MTPVDVWLLFVWRSVDDALAVHDERLRSDRPVGAGKPNKAPVRHAVAVDAPLRSCSDEWAPVVVMCVQVIEYTFPE